MRETASKLATATRTLKGELLEGDEFQKLSLRVKPLNFEGRIQAFIERSLAEFIPCDCLPERIHDEGHLMISLDAVAALCQLEPDSFARQLRTKGYRCFPRKPGCHPQFFRKVDPDPSDAPQRLAQLTAAYQVVANELEQAKARITVLEESFNAFLASVQRPDRSTFVPAGAVPRMVQGQGLGVPQQVQPPQSQPQQMLMHAAAQQSAVAAAAAAAAITGMNMKEMTLNGGLLHERSGPVKRQREDGADPDVDGGSGQ